MAQTIARIILDASGDLFEQARAAEFCLRKEQQPAIGDWSIITVGRDKNYAVHWNKASLRVYPPQESKAAA